MTSMPRENPGVELPASIDLQRIALGIQQPWAELILRGKKTIEVRSQPTSIRGSIYIYSSRRWSRMPAAQQAVEEWQLSQPELPMGQLIGQVDLLDCRPFTVIDQLNACLPAGETHPAAYAWLIGNPIRFVEPIAVRHLPYGIWFYPFCRKGNEKTD